MILCVEFFNYLSLRKNVTIAKSIFNDSIMLGIILTAALIVSSGIQKSIAYTRPPTLIIAVKRISVFLVLWQAGKDLIGINFTGEPLQLLF